MWDNSAFSNKIFNAESNIGPPSWRTEAPGEEATNFDLWRSADFLPKKTQTTVNYLLDELEQKIYWPIATDTRMYTYLSIHPYISMYFMFSIDVNVSEGRTYLNERHEVTQVSLSVWGLVTYESSMSQPFNTQTNILICFPLLICRCSSLTPLTTFPECDFKLTHERISLGTPICAKVDVIWHKNLVTAVWLIWLWCEWCPSNLDVQVPPAVLQWSQVSAYVILPDFNIFNT